MAKALEARHLPNDLVAQSISSLDDAALDALKLQLHNAIDEAVAYIEANHDGCAYEYPGSEFIYMSTAVRRGSSS